MKQKQKKISTRELGLDLALIGAKYFFQTDHLHYGYWPSDLPQEMGNLRQAQENYADMIVSHIPAGAKTILDVGAGTGALARRLISEGYEVDCVSPSAYLTERIRTLLGPDQCVFECKYEDFSTDKRYDVILFSESFQYIKLEKSIAISHKHLHKGGHLLISDFFRKPTPERGPFGGGHPLADFYTTIEQFPLHKLVDKDITPETAPNLDLVADFVEKVVSPAKERIFFFLSNNYPVAYGILRRIFRKHLGQADEKYMTGQRTGANFLIYKSYRLLLYQVC